MAKAKWKNNRKTNHLLPINTKYYLFSEGIKTEPNYFGQFKKYIESNPVYKNLVYIHPCGSETVRVLNEARKFVEDNKITKGQIWCIYDKDSFPAADFNAVVEIADSLNRNSNDLIYRCAWSNECIEIWFILHFAYYTSNNHRKDYSKYLNDKFNDISIGKYEKNSPDIFDILLKYGNPAQAIRFAKKLIEGHETEPPSNIAPATKVYELVEELMVFLPEEIRLKFI